LNGKFPKHILGEMGKHKTKDRLFVTRTEHEFHFGGKRQFDGEWVPTAKLPLAHCALTFQPCENPVCAPDGTVFEVLHILPYLKKYGKHPITGEPLDSGQLTTLKFHKNEQGQYYCPVLYEPFTDDTEIACIRTTGNVYSWQAINELNLKQKYFKDLLTGEPFTKNDIIVLHTRNNNLQSATKRQKPVTEKPSAHKDSENRRAFVRETPSLTCTTWSSDSSTKKESTTKSPSLPKGYCTIVTNHGNLNFELDSETAPKATRFFLLSLQRGCLNGVRLFHDAGMNCIRTAELQGLPGGEDKLTETRLKGHIDPYVEEGLAANKLLISSKYRLKKTCHFVISCEGSKGLEGNYVIFGTLVGKRETAQALVKV